MIMEVFEIPTMQIVPSGIICYSYWNGPRRKNKTSFNFQSFSQLNIEESKATYSGVLKPTALRKLRWCINLLVAQARWKTAYNAASGQNFQFKVNFITLTLPSAQREVSDQAIKKECLSRWIDTMRATHNLHAYVWRAERQFNGNIHFHITTDTYIPYDVICSVWNHYLARFHFIDEYRSKNGDGWPNSTDVHSVQKINNLAAYMVKYMSKNPEDHLKEVNFKRRSGGISPINPSSHPFQKYKGQPNWNDPIKGAVWDASMNLKTKTRVTFEISDLLGRWLNEVIESDPARCFDGGRFLFIRLSDDEKKRILDSPRLNEYLSWLDSVRKS